MSRVGALGLVALLGWGACLPTPVVRDRDSACRVARSALRQPLSNADLVELSAPWPRPYQLARRAHQARVAGIVLTALGSAALVGTFVTGFAVDTTQPAARIALYSVVGVTIGLGGGALLAGALAVRARARAYTELDEVTRIECP
jgi:hypothetical protein